MLMCICNTGEYNYGYQSLNIVYINAFTTVFSFSVSPCDLVTDIPLILTKFTLKHLLGAVHAECMLVGTESENKDLCNINRLLNIRAIAMVSR